MKKCNDINYNAFILIGNNKRLGVFALHGSELCIVAPIEYHDAGLKILKAMFPMTMMFGHVFDYNPALQIYLNNGFKVFDVKERYCKKNDQWIGVVKISCP